MKTVFGLVVIAVVTMTFTDAQHHTVASCRAVGD